MPPINSQHYYIIVNLQNRPGFSYPYQGMPPLPGLELQNFLHRLVEFLFENNLLHDSDYGEVVARNQAVEFRITDGELRLGPLTMTEFGGWSYVSDMPK